MKSVYFLFFFYYLQSSFAQNYSESSLRSAALEIINNSKLCVLSTISIDGKISSRLMDPHIPGSDFVVYLVTNPISRKVSEISKNRNATLLFQNQNGYVSIEGEISLVPEPNIKDDYWKKEWTPFYNDRNKALILKVNPITIEVIDLDKNIKGNSVNWSTPKIRF